MGFCVKKSTSSLIHNKNPNVITLALTLQCDVTTLQFMFKRDKTQICIGCLCLLVLWLCVIGYNKRLCVLWLRGGVYFIFFGSKNGMDFYEKLDNKNQFF